MPNSNVASVGCESGFSVILRWGILRTSTQQKGVFSQTDGVWEPEMLRCASKLNTPPNTEILNFLSFQLCADKEMRTEASSVNKKNKKTKLYKQCASISGDYEFDA